MKLLLALSIFFSTSIWARGDLFLIGGGKRTEGLLRKIIEISHGHILIVPLASEIPNEIAASVKAELLKEGATNVEVYDRAKALEQITDSHLVFVTGGSQVRLMNALKGTKALKLIRERFEADLSLAGTSAGTAIMSEIMLTGEPARPYAPGLGFMKKVILDQHFLKRNRELRLMQAIEAHSTYVGVGIDESTAIHVKDDFGFDVIGESDVMVYDLRSGYLKTLRLSSGESYFY